MKDDELLKKYGKVPSYCSSETWLSCCRKIEEDQRGAETVREGGQNTPVMSGDGRWQIGTRLPNETIVWDSISAHESMSDDQGN